MDTLLQYLNVINLFLIIGSVVGGYFTVRHGRREAIFKLKDETIDALNERIDTLETKLDDLTQKNATQAHVIDTIREILLKRGIQVIIDGDLVTISDESGTHTIRRRQPTIKPLRKGDSQHGTA